MIKKTLKVRFSSYISIKIIELPRIKGYCHWGIKHDVLDITLTFVNATESKNVIK